MSEVINSYMVNPGIQASGGDSVSYVVENGIPYAYHTFTRSGSHNFNVLAGSGHINVLVVAGGGGGGMDMGGGGGGGGVIYSSYYVSQSSTPINVFVGNGGKGAPAAGVGGQNTAHQYNISATNGENSVFGNLTAIGGGYGGSSYFDYGPNNGFGNSGGSGGGASGYSNGSAGRNGSRVTGQGNNGGAASGQYYSGGGGGAGGVGVSGPAQANGGPGIRYLNMSPFYFGGGGGGAAYSLSTGGNGGIGGGGGGAVGSTVGGAGINNGSPGGGGGPNQWANTPGGDAGRNTGGGGGGGAHYNSNNKGGEGGSGIVIVKYPLTSQYSLKDELDLNGTEGLIGQFFSGDWRATISTGNIGALPLSNPTFYTSISYPTQGDLYGFIAIGYFKPPTTGTYTFYTSSDDGSGVWIGDIASALTGRTAGNAVVNNGLGIGQGDTKRSGTINLEAGVWYPIRIVQEEGGGGDNLTFSWSGPGIGETTSLSTHFKSIKDVYDYRRV